jgi:hypothetical protein
MYRNRANAGADCAWKRSDADESGSRRPFAGSLMAFATALCGNLAGRRHHQV